MTDEPRRCCYCNTEDRFAVTHDKADAGTELRPYGPGGADICYTCANATPEREQESAANYTALLDAATAAGGGVATIGTPDGPRPGFNPDPT